MTNTRYADDILLYATSLKELEEILEMFDDELSSVGLELHEGKPSIITSDSSNSISFVGMSSKLFEMLGPQKSHKYLGKYVIADSFRNQIKLQHRIQIAWHAFHKHRRWLLNRNVPVQLRLRLFSCVVSPSVMFISSVLALTQTQLHRLGTVQRRMLRNIIGRVRIDGKIGMIEWAE